MKENNKTKKIYNTRLQRKMTQKIKTLSLSEIKYPKVLINGSCDAYILQGHQIQYVRNGVSYCRSVKNPPNNNEYTTKQTLKVDIFDICNKLSHTQKKELSDLFLIPDISVCGMIKQWSIEEDISMKKLQYLSSKIRVNSRNLRNKTEIMEKIYKNIFPLLREGSFHKLVNENVKIENISKWFCILLLKILLPEGFDIHTEMKISQDMYIEYLLLLKKENKNTISELFKNESERKYKFQHITRDEQNRIQEALKDKFCSCISKFVLQNKVISLLENPHIMKYEPISICKKTIFNRKKLTIPFDEKIIKDCHHIIVKQLSQY